MTIKDNYQWLQIITDDDNRWLHTVKDIDYRWRLQMITDEYIDNYRWC